MTSRVRCFMSANRVIPPCGEGIQGPSARLSDTFRHLGQPESSEALPAIPKYAGKSASEILFHICMERGPTAVNGTPERGLDAPGLLTMAFSATGHRIVLGREDGNAPG